MFPATKKIVPDTLADMSVPAVRLTEEDADVQGYLSFQVISGPPVYMMWRLGDAGVPSAQDVVDTGFVVGPDTGMPISVQDPAAPSNPARLYLANAGGGESDFRAFA